MTDHKDEVCIAHLAGSGVCKSWHWELFDPENATHLFVLMGFRNDNLLSKPLKCFAAYDALSLSQQAQGFADVWWLEGQ